MSRGFTLAETVVVIGVSVFALLALANLFRTFNVTYGYEETFMAVVGSSGAAMNAFESSIVPADRVLASYSFSGTAYTSGTTTLVLELPAATASGAILSGMYDYVVFYASSTSLYRLTQAATGSARLSGRTLLSATLASLAFTYDNGTVASTTSVAADVRTSAAFKQQSADSHLLGKWYLRNRPAS